MSAVSAEFSCGSANLAAPGQSPGETSDPADGAGHAARADFGPNEWLVDELYQRYQADPGSVDKAWWNFFADYRPLPAVSAGTTAEPAAEGPVPGAPAPAWSAATAGHGRSEERRG